MMCVSAIGHPEVAAQAKARAAEEKLLKLEEAQKKVEAAAKLDVTHPPAMRHPF
jgi:hypothetical protein